MVRLAGPPGNPNGVGAILRLRSGETFGPAHEIHAGSGYWSQDSVVAVMYGPKAAAQLSVRWPGGKPLTVDVPPEAREIEVDANGGVRRLK